MLREKQKIVRLLDELLTYVLRHQSQKITITVEALADRVQITLENIGIQMSERECQEAEHLLNIPLYSELRSYYGGLAGEETLYPQNLRIVGIMVDGGHLENCEDGIRLSVWWKPE